MTENYKTCQRCGGKVAAAHQGQTCPLCKQETKWNYVLVAEPGRLEITGYPAMLTHAAEWWVWNWPYLVVFFLATLGSLIFGFIPGWGGVVAAICTIIATATGFKAGMKYHKEITR
jgi:hypothetical protein